MLRERARESVLSKYARASVVQDIVSLSLPARTHARTHARGYCARYNCEKTTRAATDLTLLPRAPSLTNPRSHTVCTWLLVASVLV